MGVVTIQWILFGYSFTFSPGDRYGIFGDFDFGGLQHVGQRPDNDYAPGVPHLAYMIYECFFAVITPAIISGSVVCRMKFVSYTIFILLWSTMCYDMLAHWLWSAHGWLRHLGAIDWAGGTPIHVSSGWTSLVAAIIVGRRKSSLPSRPHNIPFVMLGAAILWFGWFGFNGGSSFAANGLGSVAFTNTHISASASMVTWMIFEALLNKGRATPVGAATGIVVGLIVITPGAGYIDPIISLPIGVIGACVVFATMELKKMTPFLRDIDDSLDVWACHGIGGWTGSILTGMFASSQVNPTGPDGLIYSNDGGGIRLVGLQVLSCTMGTILSVVTTTIFLLALKYIPYLGLYQDDDNEGLDGILHGGFAYDHGDGVVEEEEGSGVEDESDEKPREPS